MVAIRQTRDELRARCGAIAHAATCEIFGGLNGGGPGRRKIELVGSNCAWHDPRRAILIRQPTIATGVDVEVSIAVANAQNKVFLTGVQNGICPGRRCREIILLGHCRTIGPLRDIPQILKIPNRRIEQLTDIVICHIAAGVITELIQVIHHTAVGHIAVRCQITVGIRIHDPCRAIPFGNTIGFGGG